MFVFEEFAMISAGVFFATFEIPTAPLGIRKSNQFTPSANNGLSPLLSSMDKVVDGLGRCAGAFAQRSARFT